MRKHRKGPGLAAVLALVIAAAAAMLLLGHFSPVAFLATMIPFSVVNSYMRPFSTNLLLDQIQGDTGSASALLNFTHTLLGSIGMFIGSLPWGSYISGIGMTMLGFMILTLGAWLFVLKSRKISMKGF